MSSMISTESTVVPFGALPFTRRGVISAWEFVQTELPACAMARSLYAMRAGHLEDRSAFVSGVGERRPERRVMRRSLRQVWCRPWRSTAILSPSVVLG
jgi:hypothetical protein